ncbi:transglutaminase family protein [Kangiella sediminilitoris]|uniref:Transglutaminase domain protein n=1 Tax=Kangiella sediminilitoris TaxID=1144748 RepID=A0A1B3B946_9GAMM|nr:transglutaminaseTgpA domain-containing protein [Kangiella sediminilitoris]AOE49327.1 Transglutaminase domain protein [Kangiella sediminilitoris]
MNVKQLPISRPGIVPLLLLIQTGVLFPLWFFMPAWITLTTIALLLAKWYLNHHRLHAPKWILLIVVLVCVGGVFLQFKTLNGRDAGIGLISLMYGFKLLEARSYRDAALLLFISFFIVVTAFFYTEAIWMGLYLLISMLLILVGMVALNSPKGVQSSAKIGRSSVITLLQAIPIMVLLFFLFPRSSSPLWSMPNDSQSGSGIDDTMTPGSIGALHTFDDIAFRADFEGEVPKNSEMYWRGLVLSRFDGFTWYKESHSPVRGGLELPRELTYQYRIQMEPNNRNWIFGLEQLAEAPENAYLFSDYTWMKRRRVTQRITYSAQAYDIDFSDHNLTPRQQEMYLELPDDSNQRTKEWAEVRRQEHGSAETFVSWVLSYIHQNQYHYTLTPEVIEVDTVDGFWFRTQEGFCEHYAGAFVYIMRAAGIPARVVTGYQGGEYNPYGDYYIVRQKDAHAWTEVWLEGEGWRRIDPTAAIHPSRVDEDLLGQTSSRDGWLQEFGSNTSFEAPRGFLQNLALRWDAIQSFWSETVMGYSQDMQFSWLRKLGIEKNQYRYLGYGLLFTVFLAGLIFGYWVLRSTQWLDPVAKQYIKLIGKLKKQGVSLESSTGPQELLKSVRDVSPKLYARAAPAIKTYVELRYRKQSATKEQLKLLKQQVARV